MTNESGNSTLKTHYPSEFHYFSYALTVEPKTALKKLIQTGKVAEPNDEVAQGIVIL
jgi:oxygen-independent coproporphyrinogen-3 oxidase